MLRKMAVLETESPPPLEAIFGRSKVTSELLSFSIAIARKCRGSPVR